MHVFNIINFKILSLKMFNIKKFRQNYKLKKFNLEQNFDIKSYSLTNPLFQSTMISRKEIGS